MNEMQQRRPAANRGFMIDIETITNQIINADCMEILKQLPDKSIDLVLTDPPYGGGVGR